MIGVAQEINGAGLTHGEDEYSTVGFREYAYNYVEASAELAGTATVNGLVANSAYDSSLPISDSNEQYVNGMQYAGLSLNSLSGTAADGTNIIVSLNGSQTLDAVGFSSRVTGGEDYSEEDFSVGAGNTAIAFSPRPATSDYVSPKIATNQNDPTVENLDQEAVITLNTMSFGATDGTADFTVISYANEGSDTLPGQYANFSGTSDSDYNYGNQEIALAGNVMVATTDPEFYYAAAGFNALATNDEDIYAGKTGIGNTSLSNASQVYVAEVNAISEAGTGSLTLKGDAVDGNLYVPTSFTQVASNVVYDLTDGSENDGLADEGYKGLNTAIALTDVGNASSDTLTQVAELTTNTISTKGDLNSWNDSTAGEIDQAGFGVIYGEYVNEIGAEVDTKGSASLDTTVQEAYINNNTISVAGDLNASVSQGPAVALQLTDGSVNDLFAWAETGNASATDTTQVASIQTNIVSVTGDIVGGITQASGEGISNGYPDLPMLTEGANTVSVETDVGNAAVDTLDQVAQIRVNSISAGGDLTANADGAIGSVSQTLSEYGYFGPDLAEGLNSIDVESDVTGNASLKNATQTAVLYLNTVSVTGALSSDVTQSADKVTLWNDNGLNYAYVGANDDAAGKAFTGGNASINSLTQIAAISLNTVSAGSIASGTNITQSASNVYLPAVNTAIADSNYGVATANGIAQTAINRVNTISMTTVSQ